MTTYTYDTFDRLTSKSNNDGTVNYTYTADGKISSVTDSTGTTVFTYDIMDGLNRVDYSDGNYEAYSYDEACRLTSETTANRQFYAEEKCRAAAGTHNQPRLKCGFKQFSAYGRQEIHANM